MHHQPFGPLHDAREHPHAIHQQAAIGGMMDLGLHTGGIQSQLASLRHLRLPRQLDHAIVEGVQRLGAQRMEPAQQGRLIGHLLKIDATKNLKHRRELLRNVGSRDRVRDMRFLIARTRGKGEQPCEEAFPANRVSSVSGRALWYIEVESLEQSVNLADKYGDLIVSSGFVTDDPFIELYDDYRE